MTTPTWQPMANAPKDAPIIVAVWIGSSWTKSSVQWTMGTPKPWGGLYGEFTPSYWWPMPDDPTP